MLYIEYLLLNQTSNAETRFAVIISASSNAHNAKFTSFFFHSNFITYMLILVSCLCVLQVKNIKKKKIIK